MSDVVLSAGVRQNLLSLQKTADLMGTTQNRLATGKKVNSALDNPTNFFTASALQARSKDLSSLIDAMSNGIKTLQAADNGLTSITKVVESMQATVRQARQDRSFQGTSYTVDATAIGTGLTKNLSISGGAVTGGPIDIALNTLATGGTQSTSTTLAPYAAPVAAQQARYAAQNVYAAPGAAQALIISFNPNGGAAQTVNVTLDTTETTIQEAIDKINAAILLDADTNGVIRAEDDGTGRLRIVTIGNEDGTITVGGAGEAAIFGVQTTQTGSDGQYQFNVNGTAVTLTSADSPTVAAAVNTANLQLQAANSAFEAYDAGGGNLGFREKVASGVNVAITATTGNDHTLFSAGTASTAASGGSVNTVDQLVAAINVHVSLAGKVKASNDAGKLRIENLSTVDLTVVGATATTVNGGTTLSDTQTIRGNQVRKNLITQFNDLRDQLDKMADDSSFGGINLLRGDKLRMIFNEAATSTLEIQARDESGNATSINSANLSIISATSTDFDADTSLDSRLEVLTVALSKLRAQASNFGSNLSIVQNRTEFTKAMINTLQTGADALVLADTNEEGANMLALQTRQQLSTTALSLSAQADQAVLRLFG